MLDFPLELLEDDFEEEEEQIVEEIHGENDLPALHSYGSIKSGRWYTIIEEKHDWTAVKLLGIRIFVPNWVFTK